MAEDGTSTGHDEARQMLDICASVGARAVDLTLTNSAGEKKWFRRDLSLSDLARTLPAMLDDAAIKKCNVIIRPHGAGMMFLQLDDLAPDQLARVAPPCFISLETSPGNFQAWLAIPGCEDKDFARRCAKAREPSGRERSHAHRRQPQFQTEVRARLSTRCDPHGAARAGW
jgi:RepB DNA-primase from phage plasmid